VTGYPEVLKMRFCPDRRRSIHNSEDRADSRLETRIGLKATIEDYVRFAGDLPADGY
jgi:hypothetical protein